MFFEKKYLQLWVVILVLYGGMYGGLTSCSQAWAHEVVDQSGTVVKIPSPLHNIADLWFAHNETLLMLDGAGRLKATVNRPSKIPWMFYAVPALYEAQQIKGGTPNIEDFLRLNIQLVFISTTSKLVSTTLRRVGFSVIETGFTNVEELRHSVQLTADVLQTPQAKEKASLYLKWLDEKLAFVTSNLEHAENFSSHSLNPISSSAHHFQKPRVLHIYSLHPLMIDGTDSLIDTWITLAGGKNAAHNISGNMKPVSFEQIAAWNPDIIIIESNAGELRNDPASPWHWLKAVQTHKVYTNPLGLFQWDRYSLEFPLQVLWAAKLLHPALFEEINMSEECMEFYTRFFGIHFSPSEINRILLAQPPLHTHRAIPQ